MDAMIDADRIMEYTTYGTFARHVDCLKRVCPVEPSLTLYYWWAEQAKSLESNFRDRVESENPKMVLINSNTGRPAVSYRELVGSVWSQSINRVRTDRLPVV